MQLNEHFRNRGYSFSNDLDLVRAVAEGKVLFQASQEDMSEIVGVTSRTIRNKIKDNRHYYEQCLSEFEALDRSEAVISDDLLEQFAEGIIQRGLNPKTAKDTELFIDFFGVDSKDIKNMIDLKNKNFRNWFKGAELSFLDRESVANTLATCTELYQASKNTVGATNKFMAMDVSENATKIKLMYLGLLFMSMYNQVEHDSLKELGNMVVATELLNGTYTKPDSSVVRELSKKEQVTLSKDEMRKILRQEFGWSKEKIEDVLNKPQKQASVQLPEKEAVTKVIKANLHVLSFDQFIKKMFKGEI